MKLVLCTIVEASIFERSNVFDWQKFSVSSIQFDYRKFAGQATLG